MPTGDPAPSLARRLFRSLALVQAVVFTLAALASVAVTEGLTANDLGHARAARILARAATAGGLRALAPLPELAAYAHAREGLRYGVAAGGRWLDGSTLAPDLGAATVEDGRFDVAGPAGTLTARASLMSVAGVRVQVVTAGNRPGARDLGAFAGAVAGEIAALLGPILLASLLVAWWRLRRDLRPLGDLARAAAAVDLDRAHERLDLAGAPVELKPLAQAFNLALERLSTGVATRKRFLDDAAHELRTPLAVMRARVDAMAPGADRALLRRDLRRLGALSDQLLASARLASGWAPAAVPVDLGALLADLVADHAPLAHEMGHGLGLVRAGGEARVLGHPAALTAAFANLLDNALRAEPAGGSVEVRLEGRTVAIADHGSGVDPEQAGLVFEPFWRGSEARRGTGLGLAIVAETVRQHGARVRVEATPGGGATFVIAFPAPPAP